MHSIYAVLKDFIAYFNVKNPSGRKHSVALVIIALIIFVGFNFLTPNNEVETESSLKTVYTAPAGSLSESSQFNLIGSVESKNQARIQAEVGGRVTEVNVALGDTLTANQIIARLENASEYASLLQAEGAYESALAAAAQSNISVVEAQNALTTAENTAITTYRNAYTDVFDAFRNTIDTFYGDPEARIPGVKVSGGLQTTFLNNERVSFQTILAAWQAKTKVNPIGTDIDAYLTEAEEYTKRTIALVDILSNIVVDASASETLNGAPIASYIPTLSRERAGLSATLNSLSSAKTSLTSARESLRRIELGGTNVQNSTANAQVKQALGVLRAAQANYAKTILRTPIAGTLNELTIKTGDYVSQNTRVALVANNNALEVTTFVGEKDSDRISVGQSVMIEGSAEGVITAIAPAVDSVTKKIEVKIATESESIKNGDTVSITIRDTEKTLNTTGPLLLPITALKFTDISGSVFTVEGTTLVSHDVTIGSVRGSYIEITDGITPDMLVVIDARGLNEGQQVEALLKN